MTRDNYQGNLRPLYEAAKNLAKAIGISRTERGNSPPGTYRATMEILQSLGPKIQGLLHSNESLARELDQEVLLHQETQALHQQLLIQLGQERLEYYRLTNQYLRRKRSA